MKALKTLKELREAAKLSQEALADATGISQSAVSQYERNTPNKGLYAAILLSDVLSWFLPMSSSEVLNILADEERSIAPLLSLEDKGTRRIAVGGIRSTFKSKRSKELAMLKKLEDKKAELEAKKAEVNDNLAELTEPPSAETVDDWLGAKPLEQRS